MTTFFWHHSSHACYKSISEILVSVYLAAPIFNLRNISKPFWFRFCIWRFSLKVCWRTWFSDVLRVPDRHIPENIVFWFGFYRISVNSGPVLQALLFMAKNLPSFKQRLTLWYVLSLVMIRAKILSQTFDFGFSFSHALWYPYYDRCMYNTKGMLKWTKYANSFFLQSVFFNTL